MNQNHTIPTGTTEPGGRGKKSFAEGRPATVLQVLPSLGVAGGVERGTVEIAGAIVKAGGRAIVASAGGLREYDLKRVNAEHVTLPLDTKSPFGIYANIGRLEKLIRKEGVDIVHARSRAPAWSAYWAAKRTGVPFVTTFHGVYGAQNWFKRAYNHVMTRGVRVIAISAFIAGHLHRVYGTASEKIRVIHRGVDLDSFAAEKVTSHRVVQLAHAWRLEEGLPVVMLPGRLTRLKGHKVFLDAIAKLGRDDIRCVIVGSEGSGAFRKDLERQAQKLGIEGVLRIVGASDDMPAAYMLADVVVSPSIYPEAFGRTIAEAQAMGRPAIATNHGAAREILLENETGWLTPPEDVDALAAAIARALSIVGDARQSLSRKAIANVRDHFSKQAMCEKTLAVYDEVLADRDEG